MEKYANINIKNKTHTFIYMVDYCQDNNSDYNNISHPLRIMKKNNSDIYLIGEQCNATRMINQWEYGGFDENMSSEYIPSTYKLSNVKLYFPIFSVDTYTQTEYAFDIYTYIRGNKIILGTYLISRKDVLATPIIKKWEQTYCEYMEFSIADPYYILYSDDWKDFRVKLCEEMYFSNNNESYTLNNECPTIYCSLHPVNKDDRGIYITINEYTGGYNSINVKDLYDLRLNIEPILDEDVVKIKGFVKYNFIYKNIYDYINETYNIQSIPSITCDLVVSDDDDIYLGPINKVVNNDEVEFTKSDVNFDNWYGFHEGMSIICTLNIKNEDIDIFIRSNKIPLSQDLFKYFIKNESIESVNIDKINEIKNNMYNLNIVNKIVNNIVQMSSVEDVKSNIIQPVFFRVREISNIIIHPDVSENICINLDAYKSKVDTFIISIGGKSFIESGRVSAGVIFKIIGSQLNKDVTSGTYFILNENSDVVTSGKYTYEY